MASPRPNARTGRRHIGTLATFLIGASLLTACATGQRPSFDADQPLLAPTGDPGIDAVLDRLDGVDLDALYDLGVKIVRTSDVMSTTSFVRHDPDRTGGVLLDLFKVGFWLHNMYL